MCGINGFSWADRDLAGRMNVALRHRGPDDSGLFVGQDFSFGHVRLSIIDLSPAGHQPMFYGRETGAFSAAHLAERLSSADDAISIVFNGEIYNFQEVRAELEKKGYRFSTHSDTEVILASYLEWGHDCVTHLNGMWAFCLHDPRQRILFCSRDRLGVKPFYYNTTQGRFIFSSELKGILEHRDLALNRLEGISKDAVHFYFALGFIPAPHTIYKETHKLPAAHNLIFDLAGCGIVRQWQYYDLPAYDPIDDKQQLLDEGRRLLRDSVRLRMIADVPVGAFLSGGLDSSTVVGEMREFTDLSKLHTFSIGFEGKYDESRYINIVKDAFGTQHHNYYFTETDFEKLIEPYATAYDEPFGDYSGFPTYKVSQLAREHVTISLSGDGGDEVFGGYSTHVMGLRMDWIRALPRALRSLGASIPARRSLNSYASAYLLKQAFKVSLEPSEQFYARALENQGIKPQIYQDWTVAKLKIALEKGDHRLSEALRIHDLLFNTLADNFLTKVDRASMAHALEVRSPFLDYRFAELGQRIPTKWKVDLFKTKKLMREMIGGIVPEQIVKRGKQGFTPPLKEWLLMPKYRRYLEKSMSALSMIDDETAEAFRGRILVEDNDLFLIYRARLLLFGVWWERWIGGM